MEVNFAPRCADAAGLTAEAAARATESLRTALASQPRAEALTLVYQPQVSLGSGQIVGAEALLRWVEPEGTAIAPERIVALADSAGLTPALTSWTLVAACRDASDWRLATSEPLRVSLNLSLAQACLPNLAALVKDALAATSLPAMGLVIEVPEAVFSIPDKNPLRSLEQLRSVGVEVAIDNFGTGFSSLGNLRHLPINLVKIDRSFVPDVEARPGQASLTRAVVHLAHGLRMRVLAQGVETKEQLRALLATGCDLMQGWVFSPPLSSVQFADWLRAGTALPIELTHRREHEHTLLLVDDEPNILSSLRRVFRGEGYRVLTAGSGSEGLEVLKQQRIDVIVSDQRMPGMTGVEFLRQAKVLRPETVRMTLSGYTELQSIIDAVNEGAVFRFLTKPWDDQHLRHHVAEAFQHHTLLHENTRLTRELATALVDLAQTQRRLDEFLDRRFPGQPETAAATAAPITS